jgi:hypothetical protein
VGTARFVVRASPERNPVGELQARRAGRSRRLKTQTQLGGCLQAKITIELALDYTPDTGSGLPDIGHVAYALRKHIDQYEWTDKKTGDLWRLRDHWRVVALTATAHE